MSKRIKPVSNDEPCPCGSGKTYRACCLRGQVRYYRDENGEIVKFNLDCLPGSTPAVSAATPATPSDVAAESPEACDHDCEHCDQHSDSPDIAAMVNGDGELMTMVNVGEFRPDEIKIVIAHIATIQARLIQALVDPSNDESLRGTDQIILLVGHDEDENVVFGGEDTYTGIPREVLESAIGGMEKMKLELTLILLHSGISRGFQFLSCFGDDDSDDE